MQALLMSEEIKQRKPRLKRGAIAITYRLMPAVKQAVAKSAVKYGRSDNQQAEFLIKIGYLHTLGTKISNMSDAEILNKFDELSKSLIDKEVYSNSQASEVHL